MRVIIAALAEEVRESEGKLDILGLFSTIWAQGEPPIVHPEMQLVLRFEFNPDETGDKEIRIKLVDEHGRTIFAVSAGMDVPQMPRGEQTTLTQIITLQNVYFPKFGRYEFRINVDSADTRMPVRVIQATQARLQ